MGVGAVAGMQYFRFGLHSIHGEMLVRSKTLPQGCYGAVRGAYNSFSEPVHRSRQGGFGRRSGLPRLSRHSDFRSGRSGPQKRRYKILPRLGSKPCAFTPDRNRAGSYEANGNGRRFPGHSNRSLRRRFKLCGNGFPVYRRNAQGWKKS